MPSATCDRRWVPAFAGTTGTDHFSGTITSSGCATLVLHGTGDETVPIDTSARLAAAGFANAQPVEYDGAPHGLFATESDRLTRDLLAFLGR